MQNKKIKVIQVEHFEQLDNAYAFINEEAAEANGYAFSLMETPLGFFVAVIVLVN